MGVHQPPEVYLQIKELLGIPADEPIFILRAQDVASPRALIHYITLVRNKKPPNVDGFNEWITDVNSDIEKFRAWQMNNPDKVKAPD